MPPIEDPRHRAPRPALPEDDLAVVVQRVGSLWEHLRGKTLFITGATGFFGSWLVESFARANRELHLGASVIALSRNPENIRRRTPHLAADPHIEFLPGDVTTFPTKLDRPVHFIIHAAVQSTDKPTRDYPRHMLDSVLLGTRRVLELAADQSAPPRLLFTSSGAVYGKQPPDLTHIRDDFSGSPDPLDHASAYGTAKRMAENWCIIYKERFGILPVIARCFAFAGPLLPMDGTYAIGNFLLDAMNSRPIRLSGDGSAVRSYLYASDLAIWLWTILLSGTPGRAYNVGSEAPISILDLARSVATVARPGENPNEIITLGNPPRTVADLLKSNQMPAANPSPARYIPATRRAREELNLQQTIDLPDAIRRTIAWARA